MTQSVFLSFITFACLVTHAFAKESIIYGKDNRVEVFESSKRMQKLAKSVGGIFSSESSIQLENMTMLQPYRLKTSGNICDDERFIDQVNAMSCTFFLVGEDRVVTAGHCLDDAKTCKDMRFMFDYSYSEKNKKPGVLVDKSRVYKCSKVIEAKLTTDRFAKDKYDYALIQLDRKVSDREPLKFRKLSKLNTLKQVELGQELFTIGHSDGLPLKVSDDASVISRRKVNFFANLDTFHGNSGAPVFDLKSGLVEGILVRGQTDYVVDRLRRCKRVNRVQHFDKSIFGVKGEMISSIAQIEALME